MTSSLCFQLPGDLGTLEFSEEVLAHFDTNKQRKYLSREAGGQLFAVIDKTLTIRVIKATGPRKSDKRTLFGYEPDRNAERAEILSFYGMGLHFIGDWHTHRQSHPKPSPTDEKSIRDVVRSSSHEMPGFILVIVGLENFPEGLYVSFHTREDSYELSHCSN